MTQLRLISVRPVDLGKSDHRGLLATYGFGAFTFTALSANLQYTDSAADQRATVAKVATYGATIINHQEAMTDTLRGLVDGLKGYDTFWPGGRDKTGKPRATPKNYNPISYRTDVARFVRGDWHEAHKGLFRVSPTRGVSEAVLDIAGVLDFDDLNVHTVNGVDGDGKIPQAWRRAAHKKNLALVASLLEGRAKTGPVAAAGDFNTTRLRALLPLDGALFDVPTTGGTHGNRLIDYWVRPKTHAETTEAPMPDDRYDRVTFRGKTVDKYTRAALLEAERRLGYELTIVQGSYNGGGVSASAGTHDGGGAVDLAAFEADRKVRVLREVGFAAWRRRKIPGLWNEHVHAILIGNERASSGAKNQVAAYKNGRNGLKDNGADDGPRVGIHTFAYPPKPVAPKPKPAPKPAGSPEFDDFWKRANDIATNPKRSRRKRAAAAIIRAAAAPFANKEK